MSIVATLGAPYRLRCLRVFIARMAAIGRPLITAQAGRSFQNRDTKEDAPMHV